MRGFFFVAALQTAMQSHNLGASPAVEFMRIGVQIRLGAHASLPARKKRTGRSRCARDFLQS